MLGGPNPAGGWRVVQIWESEEDSQNYYNNNVEPLPATRHRTDPGV